MATETGEETAGSDVESESGISPYVRGVTVTSGATLAGIAAALVAMTFEFDPGAIDAFFVLAGAIIVQFPLYDLIGIDTGDFGPKDYLYVAFMTFALWFISWGILLTAGT